jgi:hypothetical protein
MGTESQLRAEKGTVYNFNAMPEITSVRNGIGAKKAPMLKDLLAEANIYYDDTTGIGFRGDAERKIVAGVNWGSARTIEWQAFSVTYRHRAGFSKFLDKDEKTNRKKWMKRKRSSSPQMPFVLIKP